MATLREQLADKAAELGDHVDVGQIIMLRRLGQVEVVAHEPGDEFPVIFRQAEAATEFACELFTQLRMIGPAALGNVVKEQRHEQQFRALQFRHQFRGQRHLDVLTFT